MLVTEDVSLLVLSAAVAWKVMRVVEYVAGNIATAETLVTYNTMDEDDMQFACAIGM